MSVRLPSPECGKCGERAPVLGWAQSALGVAYLVDASTGAEHARTCAGVSPRALPIPIRPAAIAEPVRVSIGGAYAPRRDLTPEPVPGGVLMRGVGGVRVFAPDAPAARAPEPEPEPEPDAEPEPEPEPDGDAEALAAEMEYADRMRDAEAHNARRGATGAEWPELRRAILAGGGIGPSADWPRDWIPGDLYRAHGKAPDLVAVETTLGTSDTPPWGAGPDIGDAAMLDYLHRAWADWQRVQEARRPRARKPAAPAARPPAQALAEPERATPRDLVADLARLVADVADLAAAEPVRYGPTARAIADLAAMVRDA